MPGTKLYLNILVLGVHFSLVGNSTLLSSPSSSPISEEKEEEKKRKKERKREE